MPEGRDHSIIRAKGIRTALEGEAGGLVPCSTVVSNDIWKRYWDRLEALARECPNVPIAGKVRKRPVMSSEHTERDAWGCLWHYPGMGLSGQVVEHPLAFWEDLATWNPPSVADQVEQMHRKAETSLVEHRPSQVDLEHGFLFLRLTYLRGFEKFMMDVAERALKLYELRDRVAEHWYQVTENLLAEGATHVSAGDDLGAQDRLLIAPRDWRELIKPWYCRIFGLARDCGATVRLHSDGYIVDIIPDLIEAGVTDLNPQDLVNGVDNLARLAKGKVHISLELDEQRITAFASRREIEAHIENCVKTLGSPGGGLSLHWTAYYGTPIDGIEAVIRAMQTYHDYWVDR